MSELPSKNFLKSAKAEYEYVAGTIFYSRNLFFCVYDEIASLNKSNGLSISWASTYAISTVKKYNGFLLEPGKPVMLVKKELSAESNQNEYWQVLFEDKIGWIGVRNLSEFRHLKKNKRENRKQIRK